LQTLRSVLGYLGQIISVRLGVMIQTQTQKQIFEQIFRMSFSCVNSYKPFELIDYARAPTHFIIRMMEGVNMCLVALLMILSLVMVMCFLSFSLTITTFILFSVFILSQRFIVKKVTYFSDNHSKQITSITKHIEQTLHSLKTIFIFHQQKKLQEDIDKSLEEVDTSTRQLHYWVLTISWGSRSWAAS
jgi:ABC-type multidrug transport system fused ATPase/permease subunit